jgi:predicted transcriptional regulator
LGIYRERLEIIADILHVVNATAKKTQIMFQANLSYKVMQKYLSEITHASLIKYEKDKQCYTLTDKGRDFLNAYKEYCKNNKNVEKRLNCAKNTKKVLDDMCP